MRLFGISYPSFICGNLRFKNLGNLDLKNDLKQVKMTF